MPAMLLRIQYRGILSRFTQLMSMDSLDRKSTRLNSSHTEIYTLSLHDALPIWSGPSAVKFKYACYALEDSVPWDSFAFHAIDVDGLVRSEEHTSELQSHRDLHSFPTRRSSDLVWAIRRKIQVCLLCS